MIKLCIFVLGTFIGSFLNVVIFRLHSGESIVFGRSHCTACKKELAWYELIPVISFLLQRGKCRHCGSMLSWQYPLVELATGALFLLGYLFLPTPLHLPSYSPYSLFFIWTICALCIVIFVYDLRYLLIPDAAIIGGSALAFLAGSAGMWRVPIFFPVAHNGTLAVFAYGGSLVLTAVLCALPFFLIVFSSGGKWMGLGDAKLAFFMGLTLGTHAFMAIFVGAVSGAIIGLGLIALGRAGMKTIIPFGPFLIFGMLAVLFWGQEILDYASGFLWLPF